MQARSHHHAFSELYVSLPVRLCQPPSMQAIDRSHCYGPCATQNRPPLTNGSTSRYILCSARRMQYTHATTLWPLPRSCLHASFASLLSPAYNSRVLLSEKFSSTTKNRLQDGQPSSTRNHDLQGLEEAPGAYKRAGDQS